MPDTSSNPFGAIEKPEQREADTRNLSQRNNNPGNIRDPATGQFKVFSSPQDGWRALRGDLTAKITGKTKTGLTPNSTLYEFAQVYAPASDKNDPKTYAQKLATDLKVPADTPIGRLHDKVDRFAKVVAHHEGYFAKNTSTTVDLSNPFGDPNPFNAIQASVQSKSQAPPQAREPSNWLTESVFRPSNSQSFKERARIYLDAFHKQLPESLQKNYAVQLAEEFATMPAELFDSPPRRPGSHWPCCTAPKLPRHPRVWQKLPDRLPARLG